MCCFCAPAASAGTAVFTSSEAGLRVLKTLQLGLCKRKLGTDAKGEHFSCLTCAFKRKKPTGHGLLSFALYLSKLSFTLGRKTRAQNLLPTLSPRGVRGSTRAGSKHLFHYREFVEKQLCCKDTQI